MMEPNRYGECVYHRGKQVTYIIFDKDVKLGCSDCLRTALSTGARIKNIGDVEIIVNQQIEAIESVNLDKKCGQILDELTSTVNSIFSMAITKNTRGNDYLNRLKAIKDSNFRDQKKLVDIDQITGSSHQVLQECKGSFDKEN